MNNNRKASSPIIAPSESVDNFPIQSVDRLALGKNTVFLFLDKYAAQFCYQSTFQPDTFYHLDNHGELDLDKTVIVVGHQKQISQDKVALIARLKKLGFSEAPIFKPYDSNIHNGTMAGFMDWLEKVRQDQRINELEKWLLAAAHQDDNHTEPSKLKPSTKPPKSSSGENGDQQDPPKVKELRKGTEKDTRQSQITKRLIEETIIGQDFKYHYQEQSWKHWNGKYWETVRKKTFLGILIEQLELLEVDYETKSNLFAYEELLQIYPSMRVDNWQEVDRVKYVSFADGVLKLDTLEVLEHKKDNGIQYCLPYSYSPINLDKDIFKKDIKAICDCYLDILKQNTNTTYKVYSQWQGNDSFRVFKLLCIANAVIKSRFSSLNYFVYLLGKPRTGKGSYIRHLTAMVGKDNYASCSADRLNEDYNIAQFIDKLIVACTDEDVITRGGLSGLRKLTGGDVLTYRQIYKEVANAPFKGSLIIAANSEIFGSRATAIPERTCFIDFNNQVPNSERDPYLNQKLDRELSEFVSIILSIPDDLVEEFIRGIKRGFSEEIEDIVWDAKTESDSITAWLEENIDFDPQSKLGIGKANSKEINLAYPNYVAFCQSENFSKERINLNEFSKRVIEISLAKGEAITKEKTKLGMILKGIKLKKETAPTAPFAPSLLGKDSSGEDLPEETAPRLHPIAPESEPIEKRCRPGEDLPEETAPLKPLSCKEGAVGANGEDLKETFSENENIPQEKQDDPFLFNIGDIVRLQVGGTDDNQWTIKNRKLEGNNPTYLLHHKNRKYPPVEKYEDAIRKIDCQLGLF